MDIRQNAVNIKGSVSRPGTYDVGDSLKLSELITKSGGLLGDAYMPRVDVIRIKDDFTEELIRLNLEQVMLKEKNNDISLQSLDQILVYGKTKMIPKTYVSIVGNVKQPGRYQLQKNMTLFDLIFRSGGYLDEDFKKTTYLNRAELIRSKNNLEKKKLYHLI